MARGRALNVPTVLESTFGTLELGQIYWKVALEGQSFAFKEHISMGVFPIMYALLDVERTIQGLPELEEIEFYDPLLGIGSELFWSTDVRHKTIQDLTQSLKSDLEWLAEDASLNDEVDNAVAFVIGGAPLERESITVSFTALDQTILPNAVRSRYALAEVSFDGGKSESILGTGHPAHPVMLAFLKALQPFHAYVIGDSVSTYHDPSHFQEHWRQVDTSTFLGPELVSIIPAHLLTREAGFAHLEQVGAGIWITVPGGMAMYGEEEVDILTFQRHLKAYQKVAKFLETVPNLLLPSERE